MKTLIFLSLLITIIPQTVFAFKANKNPFTPLVENHALLRQVQNQKDLSNNGSNIPANFVLKMVMWGGLNAALLDDASGMQYVVTQGTKIGNIRVIKILPYKVILNTPNGIKALTLGPISDSLGQKANHASLIIPNINKNIQNSNNKTIENEVSP